MNQSKYWVFTLNNYDADDTASICNKLKDSCSYFIIGREVGESGTRHLQGYCEFRTRRRFTSVKDSIHPQAHIESRRGSAAEARDYCLKEDPEPLIHGSISRSARSQPTRDDIARSFAAAVVTGHNGLVAFADEHPGTWYFSGHNLLRNHLRLGAPVERPSIVCQWFYGAPGTGKSRRAHEELADAFIKDPRTKWWSGYLRETTCIIDDYGPGGIDINHLLRWFDRYKCTVETKGGIVPLFVCNFIVTSNFHPNEIFQWGGELNKQLPALMRRINLVEF